jgi:hypothetical protein
VENIPYEISHVAMGLKYVGKGVVSLATCREGRQLRKIGRASRLLEGGTHEALCL